MWKRSKSIYVGDFHGYYMRSACFLGTRVKSTNRRLKSLRSNIDNAFVGHIQDLLSFLFLLPFFSSQTIYSSVPFLLAPPFTLSHIPLPSSIFFFSHYFPLFSNKSCSSLISSSAHLRNCDRPPVIYPITFCHSSSHSLRHMSLS